MACKSRPSALFVTRHVLTYTASVVLLNYREDGVTPYIIVWKHGLTAMKV